MSARAKVTSFAQGRVILHSGRGNRGRSLLAAALFALPMALLPAAQAKDYTPADKVVGALYYTYQQQAAKAPAAEAADASTEPQPIPANLINDPAKSLAYVEGECRRVAALKSAASPANSKAEDSRTAYANCVSDVTGQKGSMPGGALILIFALGAGLLYLTGRDDGYKHAVNSLHKLSTPPPPHP